MGLSLRKERFNRVMANRKDRAIEALKSLGNIANRNNYEFADEEVTVVYGELLAELKKVFSKFDINSSPQERFQKLIQADRIQYKLLKDEDPEVYKLVEKELFSNADNNNVAFQENDEEDIRRIIDQLIDSKFENIEKKIQRSIERLGNANSSNFDNFLRNAKNKLDNKIKGFEKRTNRQNSHEGLREGSIFILNPDFDMNSINPHEKYNKERARLRWLGNGRKIEDIISAESPYSKMPGFSKAEDCLLQDINRGRVLQLS